MNKEFAKYLEYKKENEKIKIGVAMSGGVDSSAVAYILKKQGYDIFGVTMRTFGSEDEDAKKVCNDLGIEHYVLDLREEFEEEVINYFVEEYNSGRTPNPCVVCNRHIKFGKLLEFIISKGANYMATGHYTKLKSGYLSVGDDNNKDQVYFLSQVKKENLKYIIFPVGDLEKPKLRELAKELGVRVYSKKDSQEICFVDDGKLKEFLVERTNGKIYKKGNIVDTEGNILGKHNGIAFYTIGQRKGLGISSDKPLYVLELDSKKNQVIVGENENLLKDKLKAVNINLFMVDEIEELNGIECLVKTRSRDSLHRCKLQVEDDYVLVNLSENKVRAVTPGQAIVFYKDDGKVIAGGFISE